ncbi:uncharacterized protein JCM6883_007208 [Sporobolomyces salmoneus]|uniref:uncharacterized protein n=1 Tax=Sporobolomyces salmoneus TaxID=183962 RepID=UPI00316E5FA6
MSRRHSATPQSRSVSSNSSRPSKPSSVNFISGNPHRVRWGSNKVVQQSEYSAQSGSGVNKVAGSEEEGEEEEIEFEGITLAITALRGRLGCAYYDSNDNTIYFLEDQLDSTEFDLANLALGQLLPSTVLTSSSAEPNFVSFLESTLSNLPSAVSSSSSSSASASASSASALFSGPPTRLEIRPARDFYAGQGRHVLSRLDIREGAWYSIENEEEDEPGQHDQEVEGDALRRNRELRLESFVNGLEKSPLTLGCAGALVTSIKRMRANEGDLEADRVSVSGLKLMKLDKVMQINSDALTSLQIFQQEAHASMHATRGKEGLSILNILDLTRSPLGRALMRQWLIRPSLELEVIEERHETVACLLRPENVAVADAMRSHLKSIKNANKSLFLLLSGRGKLREWTSLYSVLCFSIMLHDAALTLTRSRKVRIVDRLQDALDSRGFREIGQTMNQVIDWDTSTLQKGRVCVRPGIDSTLDELLRQLEGLPSLLSEIAADFGRLLPSKFFVDEISFVYFPQLGYLVRTQPRVPSEALEESLGATFDFQFESENSGYYKNDQCRDLDRHLGDLQSLVSVQALLEQVESIEGSVKATSEVLAEFDCLLAFAEAARDNDWNRPRMTREPVINIQGGRHPLAELCTNEFVKNDTSLVGGRGKDSKDGVQVGEEDGNAKERVRGRSDEKSMIVVAGANMSGKSVYLKQIALITYLAHIGSFVPADQALIGLTDRIMTRVSTKESITRGSSGFMIDLQQISYMLRNATPRSLLIIDEFGKGTDSNDGAGLFSGVIQTLLQLGGNTPRVAVATHFQAVFANGLLSSQLPIHLAHMEVLIHDATSLSAFTSSSSNSSLVPSRNVETLTYLYRLAPGLMRSSHAAACAKLFDIPSRIVERANFVTEALSRFDIESILRDPDGEEEESEREREELEELARRFVEWDLDEMESGRDGCDVKEIKARLIEMLGPS